MTVEAVVAAARLLNMMRTATFVLQQFVMEREVLFNKLFFGSLMVELKTSTIFLIVHYEYTETVFIGKYCYSDNFID